MRRRKKFYFETYMSTDDGRGEVIPLKPKYKFTTFADAKKRALKQAANTPGKIEKVSDREWIIKDGRKIVAEIHKVASFDINPAKRKAKKKTATRGSRRTNSRKSNLWIVFKYTKGVTFLTYGSVGVTWTKAKRKAILFDDKSIANIAANQWARKFRKYQFGVASSDATAAEIKRTVTEKR